MFRSRTAHIGWCINKWVLSSRCAMKVKNRAHIYKASKCGLLEEMRNESLHSNCAEKAMQRAISLVDA